MLESLPKVGEIEEVCWWSLFEMAEEMPFNLGIGKFICKDRLLQENKFRP